MSPDIIDKAFEPFFTTKKQGPGQMPGTSGSGLGLSMVYGFVKQSKGHVHIDSTPGNGTMVSILLPKAADETALSAPTDIKFKGVPKGTETIMVVEDDPDVSDFVVNALQHLGYQVICAHDGAEALRVAESAQKIDLLISDVVLPGGLTGPAIVDRILEKFKDTKVLFTSGYVAEDIRLRTRRDGEAELLTKPYTVQALAHKVRNVLETDPQSTDPVPKVIEPV